MMRRFIQNSLKIKSQIVILTAVTLCVIMFLQIILYFLLQHESDDIITSVFDSVSQNTTAQIEKLNDEIMEISSLLAVQEIIQESIYTSSPSEIVKNLGNLQNLIYEYKERNQNIAFLGLIKHDSLFMSSESVPLYSEVRNLLRYIPDKKITEAIFTPSFIYEGHTYFGCITPIFSTNISYITPAHPGNYVVCIYEMNSVSYAPYAFIDNSQIGLIVTDEENRILLSADTKEHGKEFIPSNTHKNFLYRTLSINNPKWNITVLMPSDSVSNLSTLSHIFIGFMIILSIVMLIIMFILLNNIIIKKIELLKKNVSKISDNDRTYRIQYNYNDELSEIVSEINKVLETLHGLNEEKLETLDRLYQAQLLQKETQIFYLFGQVSPHFLYNSLSYIQGVAFKYNATEIVHMTSSLSKVFRYFSNNLSLSTIKQDLDCAIEYFNVINIRRENPITLINTVDEELLNVRCLKMIYQPILENVLKHAFSIDESGTVTISSVPDKYKAIIDISDTGKGFSESILRKLREKMNENDLNKIQNSEHIGLLNVNMRLKLYYKESGIEIRSTENKGATIRIIFDKEASASSKNLQIKA